MSNPKITPKKILILVSTALIIGCKIYNSNFATPKKTTSIMRSDFGDYAKQINKR